MELERGWKKFRDFWYKLEGARLACSELSEPYLEKSGMKARRITPSALAAPALRL